MKIKNCPFCGGEVQYHIFPGVFGYTDDEHVIICRNCNLRMRDHSAISIHSGETEKFQKQVEMELINRWNTRV